MSCYKIRPAKTLDNFGGKSQKHDNSRCMVSVREHAFACGVVPDHASSCGQMALGPICQRDEVTLHNGVKAPVDFPLTQTIAYDA